MSIAFHDGKEFNDPEAWGYCRYCAFEVAAGVYNGDTVLADHQRRIGDRTTELCFGSGTVPHEKPGPEAEPVEPPDAFEQITFHQDPNYEPMDSSPIHPRAQAAASANPGIPLRDYGGMMGPIPHPVVTGEPGPEVFDLSHGGEDGDTD